MNSLNYFGVSSNLPFTNLGETQDHKVCLSYTVSKNMTVREAKDELFKYSSPTNTLDYKDILCYKNNSNTSFQDDRTLKPGETVFFKISLSRPLTEIERNTRHQLANTLKKDRIPYQPLSQQEQQQLYSLNMSSYTQYLCQSLYKPRFLVGNLYFSLKISDWNAHQYLIAYQKNGNTLEPIVYRRSNSESSWRLFVGNTKSNKISKAEFIPHYSYEMTTRIPGKLSSVLDTLPAAITKIDKDDLFSQYPTKKDELSQIQIHQLFPEQKGSAVSFYKDKPISEIKHHYENLIPQGLQYTKMKQAYSPQNHKPRSYTYQHQVLGTVHVNGYTMPYTYQGKTEDVIFYFAHSEGDNKCWIENVAFPSTEKKYCLALKQLNIGPLAAKPLDYSSQCPKELNIFTNPNFDDNTLKKYGSQSFQAGNGGDLYIDLRFLYQDTPLIKYYREHHLPSSKK